MAENILEHRLMTRGEFDRRITALKHRSAIFASVYISVLVSAVAVVWWMAFHKSIPWVKDTIIPFLLLLFVAHSYFMKRSVKSLLAKYGLFCPVCGKTLYRPPIKIVDAVGTCGSCGATVFEE